MTVTRVLSMANGLAYLDVTFDDAGNAVSVHAVNGSTQTASGVMNGVAMTLPAGADATIPIPSQGFPAFTDETSASAVWPVP